MKLIESKYIGGGPAYHRGMECLLAKMEEDSDFDRLWDDIIKSGLYGKEYFDKITGNRKISADNILTAAIMDFLAPKKLLEIGCGAASDLLAITLFGKAETLGVDFSEDIIKDCWPGLENRLRCGDVAQILGQLRMDGERFDMIMALDIWEHFTPGGLAAQIQAVAGASTEDALFFFVIPAFGEDKIFGEIFPLEFEENRNAFGSPAPFDHIPLISKERPIPKSGHLILARSDWWERQFNAHGLVRAMELEIAIHKYFGPYMFYARRTFYVFRKSSPAAEARVARLAAKGRITFATAPASVLRAYARARAYEGKYAPGVVDRRMTWDILGRMYRALRGALYERVLNVLFLKIDLLDGGHPHLMPQPLKAVDYAVRWMAKIFSAAAAPAMALVMFLGHLAHAYHRRGD